MRIVVDGIPVRGRSSLGIVVEHLLAGWEQLDSGDELHIVLGPDPGISVPESVTVHHVNLRLPFVSRVYAQSSTVPRLCRSLDAQAPGRRRQRSIARCGSSTR